ncbi:MAG: toluene tolerance protein [Gammaproteobacteria bacterium]|nr:toluene tolerance protein [Gammaproteobacteria bacterium]
MLSFSAQYLEQLIADCQVLEADGFGPKVLESADELLIYKLFRRKRWFSSALFSPYAKRFAANATKLKSRGFRTVEVQEIGYCKQLAYHMVVYDRLPGQSLRDRLKSQTSDVDREKIFVYLGKMMARLHASGVYFRSLHLGNLLWSDGGDFPLIDIADMRFYRRALSTALRQRNFRPLLKRMADHTLIGFDDWQLTVESYLDEVDLSTKEIERVKPQLLALGERLRTDLSDTV